jgi:hypothetical protein
MIRRPRRTLFGVTLAAIVALPLASFADGVTIAHDHMACMIAGKFPMLEAKLDPVDQVARARVDFQAEGGTHWYYVDMTPGEHLFRGVLPKPLKKTKKVHYYIEATDKALVETRTQEYVSEVVDSAGICADPKKVAGVVLSASVKVGATAGAPAVPSGFASVGIVGTGAVAGAAAAVGAGAVAGSGLSGAAIAGIAVAGAGAATVGIIAATKGSSPPPLPTGTFNGTLTGFMRTWAQTGTDFGGPFNCTGSLSYPPSSLTLAITDTGGSATINFTWVETGTGTPAVFCNGFNSQSPQFQTNLQATVSGAAVTAVTRAPALGFTLQGTRGGTTISGTFTLVGGSCQPIVTSCTYTTGSGTFTATK